jgi:hypothetical protein
MVFSYLGYEQLRIFVLWVEMNMQKEINVESMVLIVERNIINIMIFSLLFAYCFFPVNYLHVQYNPRFVLQYDYMFVFARLLTRACP